MPQMNELKALTVPKIKSITDNRGSITGPVALNGLTDDATLLLSGNASVGSKVSIFDQGRSLGTATVNSTGTWTFTTGTLPDGKHIFSAKATDAAGHASSASANYPVTVDTHAPTLAISAVTAFKIGQATKVMFNFSEAAVNFTATDITASSGTLSNFTKASLDGKSYSAIFTPVNLSGSINVAAGSYTDVAGNQGTASNLPFSTVSVSPTTTQTSGNDVLNATVGSVTGAAVSYDALYGNDRYVITLGSGNTILSGANVSINHFASGDKLVFDADSGANLATLNAIYAISDNGSDVALIANNSGTVQMITLIGLSGSRAGVGGSVDTVTELNTFLGNGAIDFM